MTTALPWVFGIFAAALTGLALALWLAQRRTGAVTALPQEWPLTSRAVFSSDERRAYRHLRQALPYHLVLAKLPLVRFCQPAASADLRHWYRLLGSAQVGFAVCSPQGRVLLAADLDTGRSLSERAQRALEIKRRALAACEIPYERWTPDQLPRASDLQDRLPAPSSGGRGQDTDLLATIPAHLMPVGAAATLSVSQQTSWRESGFYKDELFDADLSSFGHTGFGRTEGRGHPDDIVGIVVDTPLPVVRH